MLFSSNIGQHKYIFGLVSVKPGGKVLIVDKELFSIYFLENIKRKKTDLISGFGNRTKRVGIKTHKISSYLTIYIIKKDIHICMLPIAGQTAGLNGLTFFVETHA